MPAKTVEDEFEDAVSLDHAQSSIGEGDDASQCKHCGAQLGKRHLNPRHHCRVCGAACCGHCTPNQLKLDGVKGTARACIQCVATAVKIPVLKTELGNLSAQLHSLASAEPTSQPETLEAAVKLIEAAVPLLEASKAAAEKMESQEAELTREKELRVSLETELAQKEKGTAGEELVKSIEQLEAELAHEKELRSALEESQAELKGELESKIGATAQAEEHHANEIEKLRSQIEIEKQARADLEGRFPADAKEQLEAELAREKQARAELEGRPPQEALDKLIEELALEKQALADLQGRLPADAKEQLEAELAREKQARAELEGRPPQEALVKLQEELALEKLARSELEARFSPDPQHDLQSELARERQLREEVEAKHAEELAFHQRAAQAATDALAAAQSGEPVPQANTAQLKRLAAEKSEYERQLRDALNAKEKQVLINAELQASLARERTAMKELKHGVLCCPVQ